MRSQLVVLASFLVVLAAPSFASAQVVIAESTPPATLTLSEPDAELASIDAQSTAATALYVTSLTLHIGGLGLALGGALANFCLGSECSYEREQANILAGVGLGVSALGALVLLPIAIGLDVGSGRRRREHAAGLASLSVRPGLGGLTLAGTF